MSRVSDDSSENRRIREMDEAKLRQKIDGEKRGTTDRAEKSFQQVMADRQGKSAAQQAERHQTSSRSEARTQGEKKTLQDTLPSRSPLELARRAALSRTLHQGLDKTRNEGTDQLQRAEQQRTGELTVKNDEEVAHVDREVRDEEVREAKSDEERVAEKKAESETDAPIDRDAPKRDRRGAKGGDDKAKAEGVSAADGPRAAHRVQIPREVLEALVKAIHQAVKPDGRTEMRIQLKGDQLEGVSLNIRAENGRVSCSFEGCDRELRTALKASQGALAKGLERRGLKLMSLEVG